MWNEKAFDILGGIYMESNSRQYGIDVARLASMFMVVLLHNLLQGGGSGLDPRFNAGSALHDS